MGLHSKLGEKAHYVYKEILHYALSNNLMDVNTRIVWQGGEPVLSRDLISSINMMNGIVFSPQLILTNSVKCEDAFFKMLSRNEIFILTTLAAGTRDTYKIIHGKDVFEQVINNLATYKKYSNNVMVQFLCTKDCKSLHEIEEFIRILKHINVKYTQFIYDIFFTHQEVEERKNYESLFNDLASKAQIQVGHEELNPFFK